MVNCEEKVEYKKEYTAPQMEILAFEAPVTPLCSSGGDVEECTEGVDC